MEDLVKDRDIGSTLAETLLGIETTCIAAVIGGETSIGVPLWLKPF